MTRIALPDRPRILVVALRRLGDVLLTTPLIRSLRRAWPDATIDALVFSDTVGILAGNPDLDAVIAMPARPTTAESLALAAAALEPLRARRLDAEPATGRRSLPGSPAAGAWRRSSGG